VCEQCVTKYLNAKFKGGRYFVNEVETQLRKKNHSGAAKPMNFTIHKTKLVTKQ
jgi:hypothetical protein